MKRTAAAWAVALSIALARVCAAADDEIALLYHQGLLDPDLKPEARAPLVAQLLALADGGNHNAEFVAGTLYRQGAHHPASVVPLLHDASIGYDEHEQERLLTALNAAIGAHDADIRQALQKFLEDAKNADLRVTPSGAKKKLINPAIQPLPHAGIAEFITEFHPDGSVGRVWLLDAMPDAKLGRVLRQFADAYVANPRAPGETKPRFGIVPIVFDDKQFAFKK